MDFKKKEGLSLAEIRQDYRACHATAKAVISAGFKRYQGLFVLSF